MADKEKREPGSSTDGAGRETPSEVVDRIAADLSLLKKALRSPHYTVQCMPDPARYEIIYAGKPPHYDDPECGRLDGTILLAERERTRVLEEALRPEQAGALLDLLRERGVEVGGVTTCAEPLYSAMAALASLAAVAVEDDDRCPKCGRRDDGLRDWGLVHAESCDGLTPRQASALPGGTP